MPGSCDSDQSSSSNLISSLRRFRFQNKSKPSENTPSSSSSGSSPVQNSKDNATGTLGTTQYTSKPRVVSQSATLASSYNPLSYRIYKSPNDAFSLLEHIKSKVKQVIKNNFGCNNLLLQLSSEESKKLKEIISQSSPLSERWASEVTEEVSLSSDSEKAFRIKQGFLQGLVKHIDGIVKDTFTVNCSISPQKTIKSYSRSPKKPEAAASNPSNGSLSNTNGKCDVSPSLQKPAVMDDYESFCEKEQHLRKILDAFPGADIMEAQDILVGCQWDLEKALKFARSKPLRSGRKRSFSSTQMNDASPRDDASDSNSQPNVAEEIVIDSSDEEEVDDINMNNMMQRKNAVSVNLKSAQIGSKRQRILSSDSEEECVTNNSKSVSVSPKSYEAELQKPCQLSTVQQTPPQLNVSKSIPNQQVNVKKTIPSSPSGIQIVKSNPHVPDKNLSSGSLTVTPIVKSNAEKSECMPNLPKALCISKIQVSNSPGTKTLVNTLNGKTNISERSVSALPKLSPNNSINKGSAHLVRIKTNSSSSLAAAGTNSVRKVFVNSKAISISPAAKPMTISSNSLQSTSRVEVRGNEERLSSNSKTLKPKIKRKKLQSEDEDEDYGNEDIYDSDDSDCEENLTSAHCNVLKFFQEASVDELSGIPGCSKKKVEAIIKARPFNKWLHLVEKLRNDKNLSTDMLNGAKKVLDMRNAITKLMVKCQQISLDMEDLVENLKENNESSKDYVGKQPSLLNERMHLTAYQLLGLNWLLLLHNQEVNGILADEMGLGKTVQALAFLAYLKEIDAALYPHLIVVPSSTRDNWRKEIETWWPTVSIICYHGSQESRRELRSQILNEEVEEFDVMITTYNMVTSSAEDRNFFKNLQFHYVVFDEAHMLKNMSSQRYQNLMRIKAPRRLLLTGTPLQNNLVELMSLLIFAMPDMFSGKIEQVKQMFASVTKSDGTKTSYEKDRIDHAKKIMKPFVLRRLKKDVLKDLPVKKDEIRKCEMTEDQRNKYKDLVARFSAEVQKDEEKSVSSNGIGMMMQLRRAANHPLLLRRFYNDEKLRVLSKLMLKEPTHCEANPDLIFEDMSVMSDFEIHKLCSNFKSLKNHILSDEQVLCSGKFKTLDSLIPNMIEQDHRILLFSQFTMVLDIIEEYMNIRGYKFLRLDGQVPVMERQQLIDDFNNDPEILVFLLSTRAGGLGINLTSADTVILHDIDFNPYNDKQAEDRCHRVGQTRDVTVIRLISENSIEEGILQRATEKLKLERDIHEQDETDEEDTTSVAMLLRDALGLKAKS